VVLFTIASLLHTFEWQLADGMSAEELDVSKKFTTANALAVPEGRACGNNFSSVVA
jgi:hypothetical protein